MSSKYLLAIFACSFLFSHNRGAVPRARRRGAGLPADIRRAQSGPRSEFMPLIPFELKIPNEVTAKTLKGSEDGNDLHTVNSVDELFKELDS